MGADSGLKVYVGDEAKSESSQATSSAIEVIPSNGLRNRKHTKAKGSSTGNAADDHSTGQVSEAVGDHLEAMEPSRVVGHYQSSGTSDSGWMAKIAALLVGEDPSQSYALICGSCHMHNGLTRKEDFPHVTYYCPHCHALNMSNQTIGR
uniref:Lunapark zinc ribbon domain-containing protein n=1 Tax=Oryza meridionalis TaxID=40149 RepID=A0A0E0DG84_9ORYZ